MPAIVSTHFTPTDPILSVQVNEYADVWEARAKLPVNPEAREILRFRYNRRVEVLRYGIQTYKRLLAFDRAIAKEISRLHRIGKYPRKRTGLFQLGRGKAESDVGAQPSRKPRLAINSEEPQR